MLKGNILITGGAGYLGRAIVRRAITENWDCSFSILSRDPNKHHQMIMSLFSPFNNWDTEWSKKIRYIIGDICDLNGLSKAFAGHDIVIHAAAQKHIPEGEINVEETIRVNYFGSRNVARAAIEARVEKVIGISTDKVAHSVNVYGATKFLMERLFQEYDRKGLTEYSLVRYGNVLSSTGSVLTVWQKMLERDGFVTATDPHMSRFWMSIDNAVDCVLASLNNLHGTITIPKCKALDMKTFALYTMPGVEFKYSGMRPGEKRYEELITREEAPFVNIEDILYLNNYYTLYPIIGNTPLEIMKTGEYRSDNCEQLSQDELLGMLK